MDDRNNTPDKRKNINADDQHTKQFDAVITPNKSGQRNILRPNEAHSSQNKNDVYVSPPNRQDGMPVGRDSRNIMRPPQNPDAQNRQRNSSPIPVAKRPAQANKPADANRPPQQKPNTAKKAPPPGKKPVPPAQNRAAVKTKTKETEKKKSSIIGVVTLVAFIIGLSAIIAIYTLGCVNDVLALNRSSEKISVSITDDMSLNEIISQLKERGLIKNEYFCTLMATFRNYDNAKFQTAIYELRPNMGLEGMLNEMKTARSSNKTVTLVFPEGYTADQIFAKLEKFEVCTASSLYTAMNQIDFSKDFTFLKTIDNKNNRYRWLDGFLYPDTYEFYIGENATSVIKRFLTNFEEKWTDEYAKKAKDLNMSVDQIIKLASIIEKEAYNADQMYTVSGILHNRLNDKSGGFYRLNCDSTSGFIMNSKELIQAASLNYDLLLASYDTYQCTALPPGAICNPGDDAIHSALNPEKTSYMYFRHDKNGKIYLAQTEQQHNSYQSQIDAVNKQLENEQED